MNSLSRTAYFFCATILSLAKFCEAAYPPAAAWSAPYQIKSVFSQYTNYSAASPYMYAFRFTTSSTDHCTLTDIASSQWFIPEFVSTGTDATLAQSHFNWGRTLLLSAMSTGAHVKLHWTGSGCKVDGFVMCADKNNCPTY